MKFVNSVKVTPKTLTLRPGDWYYHMSVEIYPLDAYCRYVTWHSDNSSVASVNTDNG